MTFWCPRCNTRWPDIQPFTNCPKDQAVTRLLGDDPDLSIKDAKQILHSYLEFDKFLAKRDRAAA